MKLSLGPVRLAVSVAALAVGLGFATLASGCAGSGAVQTAAAQSPVDVGGTTSLTSATLTPCHLAPAAWDPEESSSAPESVAPASAAAPIALSTWGTAVVAPPAAVPSN